METKSLNFGQMEKVQGGMSMETYCGLGHSISLGMAIFGGPAGIFAGAALELTLYKDGCYNAQ